MNIGRKAICIVRSSDFDPEPRAIRLAKFLSDRGADVQLLGLNRRAICRRVKLSNDMQLVRMTLAKDCRLPAGTMLIVPFILIWMIWSLSQLLHRKPDLVIACDLDGMIPCTLYSVITGTKVVYEPYDFYAGRRNTGVPIFLSRAAAGLENRVIEYADGIILPDLSRVGQYRARNFHSAIVEILNTPEDCPNLEPPAIPRRDPTMLILFYSGMLLRSRGLIDVIKAIDGEPNVSLTLAGFGQDEAEIALLASKSRNSRFLGRISHNEVMSITRRCDVVVSLYDPEVPNNRYASPNKLFEAMCCSKPVIVSKGTTLAEFVQKHKCGVVVDYGDCAQIRHAIRCLRDEPSFRQNLGNSGRNHFQTRYSWGVMEERLEDFFQNL